MDKLDRHIASTDIRVGLGQPADDSFSLRLCAWSGPAATVLAPLGMIIIGGYLPATNPAASGAEIARFYTENLGSVRLGMVLAMIGFTLFVPFGVGIAMLTRRIEPTPVLTYVQIVAVAISALEAVMATCIWLAAAFRPDEISPDITRALHDLGWLSFLVDVPPYTLWMSAIGVAILRDRSAVPLFPRWLGFLNFWTALLMFPGLLVAFFKSGPFAYNGLLGMYIPFGAFFVWMLAMTVSMMRVIGAPRNQ